MGKGRKPIPTELKRLVGNPGKRPLNERQPRLSAALPVPPAWLPDEARAMWLRVCGELQGAGVLSPVDEGALAGYCVAWDQLVASTKLIATDGLTMPDGNGNARGNPATVARNHAMSQLRAFGSELGLSPVARTRLQAPTRDDDEFETWQAKHTA